MPEEPRTWLVGALDTGDEKYFTSLNWDGGYSDPLDGYTHRIRLSLQIHNPNEGGFHVSPEGDHLHAISDSLVAASRGTAVEVGSFTSKGVKNFFYYAKTADWLPGFEDDLRTNASRAFAVEVEQDPEWNTYRQILSDAIRADSDRKVLANLAENGADLEQPHEIDWFLYFPTETQARAAERVLADHEYQVQVNPPPDEAEEWCVIGTLNVPLSTGYIATMTRMFEIFARDNGGTYDGWGAVIEPRRETQ
jgi:hypothetical protein